MAFTISGSLAVDETSGTQQGSSGSNAFADNDVSLATFSSASGAPEFDLFLASLFLPTPTGASVSNASSANPTGTAILTNLGANVTDLAFTDANGDPLDGDVAKFGAGATDFLRTADGFKIYLYSYTGADVPGIDENNVVLGRKANADGTANASGDIVFAAYLQPVDASGNVLSSDAGAVGAKVWLVEYQPLDHAVDGSTAAAYDDARILFDPLFVTVSNRIDFSLEGAPSGQNLFLMFGDGTPTGAANEVSIVVTGEHPINQSEDSSGITSGDTVNTGQGGGGTTLGSNNQMVDPNEGMYFTFVTAANTNFTVPNLDQNEADVEANIDFGGLFGATAASFSLSQLQPPKAATLKITAMTTAFEDQNNFIDGLGLDAINPAADDTLVAITSVKITTFTKVGNSYVVDEVYTFTSNDTQIGRTVTFSGGIVTIEGAESKDLIEYTTTSQHNRVLIENIGNSDADLNAAFDIGSFNLTSAGRETGAFQALSFQDDGPSATGTAVTDAVDEDGLAGGIAGGPGDLAVDNDDGDNNEATTSGSVAGIFSAGADGLGSYGLSTDTSGLPALTSKGATVLYDVTGNLLTAYVEEGGGAGYQAADDREVFSFSLNGTTGAYTFTLLDQLDHPTLNGLAGDDTENDLTLNLGSILQVFDKDGDFATAAAEKLVITVDDDTPTATGTPVTATVDEDGLSGGIAGGVGDVAGEAFSASGSIAGIFQSGADEPVTYSLSTDTSGLPVLNSKGAAVVYDVTGNLLTAYVEEGGGAGYQAADDREVFTLSVNGTAGAYTFTLLDQLDHPTLNGLAGDDTENDLVLNLGSILQATDKDGDKVTAAAEKLVITVDDDTPTATGTPVTATVDEDGLAGGIAGGVGDVAGEAFSASGSIAGIFQSGADEPVTYGLSTDTSGLSQTLTSKAGAVVYDVSGNLLTAYVEEGGGAGYQAADDREVFTLSVNGTTGAYIFTLLDQLDHPTLNGVAGDDTENDITLNLGSILQATDKDGDKVTAAAEKLVITVDDDTPTATGTAVTATVDEDGLSGGIAGGVGDVAGEAFSASGSIAGIFQSGADEPLTYSLSTDTSGLSQTLTSKAGAVVYDVTGNLLTAYVEEGGGAGYQAADDREVFTLSVNGTTGAYTFTLLDQLDHPTLNGLAGDNTENDITLNLGSILQATDKDGDTVTAAAEKLVVTVDDDTPTATGTAVTATVDEDGLAGGIAGGVGDVAGEAFSASGSVAGIFQSGADEPATFSLSTDTSGLPQTLTSQGGAVIYNVNGNLLTAYVEVTGAGYNAADDREVFTFSLNGTTGAYTFTLLDQLDHPTLNGLAGDDTENDITLNLGSILQATDKDGDTVTAAPEKLVITVDDDTPVITTKSNLFYSNSANPTPGGTGLFDYSIGADARSSYSLTNSDLIVALTGVSVGSDDITNESVIWASESDTQAVFDVAFTYVSNPLSGDTTNATGTLTFDKVGGTYTLSLSQPISSFNVLSTATAQGFTGYQLPPNETVEDNTQPDVTVAQLASNFFVQFTGYQEPGGGVDNNSGNNNLDAIGADDPLGTAGDDAFVNGEVFKQVNTWVSVSGTAAGVAGDTMQQGEVLDFDFFSTNPFGDNTLDPTTTSSTIFIQFDALDNNEDLVVILKLINLDTDARTTRAVIADYEDIFHAADAGSIPPAFGFTGTLDNNDGLVVIEQQDYIGYLPSGNWAIEGAQVLASTEGVTGTGINLNGDIGTGGNSTGTQIFGDSEDVHNTLGTGEAGTWDGDVFKIINIGFVTSVTPDALLTFDVTVVDADGDATSTQTLNVNLVGNDGLTATADPDSFDFSTLTDADGLLSVAMYNIDGGFASGTDKLDFAAAGSGTNYAENLVAAASVAAFVGAADTALDGTVDYYFGVVGSNGYLAFDDDGNGITSVIQLVGVTDMAFGDII